MRLGGTLPAGTLVDQDGRIVQLAQAFRGQDAAAFVHLHALSGSDALPGHQREVRVSPAAVSMPGDSHLPRSRSIHSTTRLRSCAITRPPTAREPRSWTLLTGTGSTIQRLLDEFGISSMRVSASNFLHDDRLFIVTPTGKIAYVVETGGWDPQSVIAQARAVSGLANNPFERFKLALVADVVALCGGSEFAGIVLLELSLFTILTMLALVGLWVVARVLWRQRATNEMPSGARKRRVRAWSNGLSWKHAIERYGKATYNFAYRLTGNEADASDLTQEAFIRVYRAWQSFKPGTSFLSWIYRIVTNLHRDELRRRKGRYHERSEE